MKVAGILNQTVASPVKMVLHVEKKVEIIGWITIPCIDGMGSCTYNDVCEKLKVVTACPAILKKHNIPCKCPFPKGSYNLPTTAFTIKADPVPSGEYRAQVNLYTGSDNKPVYCINLDATIN